MPTAQALVATDRPDRYLKQLVSHFSAKIDTGLDADGRGRLTFGMGTCRLESTESGLLLHATAETAEQLDQLRDVVARHLVRFGTKDELQVDWTVD